MLDNIRKIISGKLLLLKDESFLKEAEGRLLLFTVSVVLLACLSFAFGGVCATWQWWIPLILIAIWGMHRHWRSAITFLAIILVMWFYAPFWLDSYKCCDTPAYHLPMVRLLCFGWNPFYEPDAQGICAQLGLDWWGMRPYHLAYCSKPAAIFCAVAYRFVHAPYSITYSLPFLLTACVFFTALRVFRKKTISLALFMVLLLWRFLPKELFVDCSLMLASAGLLLTMFADLRDKRISLLPLAGYGFWVANLKLPGVMAAGIFFVFFAAWMIFYDLNRKMSAMKFAMLAFILAISFGLASFNPYGTSLRDAGHPLYPFVSAKNGKCPPIDIAPVFKTMNDDAKEMGRVGLLVNAYLSPRLARAYYNWKLNRNDFKPHKLVWDYMWHDNPNARMTSTSIADRFWLLLAILLMISIRDMRTLGLALLALVILFPIEQIGIMRYQPWIMASLCLAITVATDRIFSNNMVCRRLLLIACISYAVLSWGCWFNRFLSELELDDIELRQMPRELYTCYVRPHPLLPEAFQEKVAVYLDRRKTHSLDLVLRNRQAGIEDEHKIVCIGDEDIEELGVVFSKFGYYSQPFRPDLNTINAGRNKITRLLHRISNMGLLVKGYGRRFMDCF